MSGRYNDTDKDLFHKWQQETENHSQQLNSTEMEKLLKKASSDFSDSIKRTIKIDMIFKSCLMAGFLIVLVLYNGNSFVLITSILFITFGVLGLLAENVFIKGINKSRNLDRNVSDLIRDELKFYRSNMIRYPVVLSISIALFYVLGNMVYHAIKYGFIRPFRDVTDVLVFTGLMVLGVVISIGANFPFFRSKINNLESLMNDLGDEENFKAREREIVLKKHITLALYILIGLVGIIALIFIITQL